MITQFKVLFQSESDALKVAEQLPESKIVGTQVSCQDIRALSLAIGLANVDYVRSLTDINRIYPHSNLPYPQHEREYNGDSPRIHVRCLSAYNNSRLHGLWINAIQEPLDILSDIKWMLSWSPVRSTEACEEWAIHDYEGFGSFNLEDYESLKKVSKMANLIQEHGDTIVEYISCEFPCTEDIEDWDELLEKFKSAYVGHYESQKAFAESDYVEELYSFKALQEQFPFWANNIDWNSVAGELFMTDFYSAKATGETYGIYVFRNL